jgi:MarR family transcriptional regulator, 2-MHQ and catechol-resistance regulon repressor
MNLYIKTFMTSVAKSEPEVSGVHLWLILWKAFRAMEAHADRSIAGLGLCLSDFGVMEALLHKGPLAVKTLGERVLLTSGSMTAAVDRLERRGWVERGSDPEDRRSRIVRLTAEGLKTIEALFASHERDMERVVTALIHEERAQLAHLLRRLGGLAVQAYARPAPRAYHPSTRKSRLPGTPV